MGQSIESARSELTPAYAAVRTQWALVTALVAIAALGWVWTAHEMRGMDAGPWTSLGGLVWFLGVWVVMMAAMMFPSVAPTIALYTRMTKERSPLSPWLFAAGYLLMLDRRRARRLPRGHHHSSRCSGTACNGKTTVDT